MEKKFSIFLHFLILFLFGFDICHSLETAHVRKRLSETKEFEPPQQVFLANRPKPQTVDIFNQHDGSFTLKDDGDETNINLERPSVMAPPIFYHMQNYTTENGLLLDNFHGGTFDRLGNLWIATDGEGVSKYDGQTFTNYTHAAGLPHGIVWRILEDKNGDLWFATDGGGIAKYNGIFFTIFTTEHGLASNHLRGILEDHQGNLWFSTYGEGVSKFDGKTFTNFTDADGLGNNKVYEMSQDKNGNIWFATEGGGASKFDGESFINYTKKDGLASNRIRAILVDKKGNVWFGTDQSGVSKFDGKTFITFTASDGLCNNNIWNIMEDKKGHIWFGTDKGACEYDGETFISYVKENGLTDNNVRRILEDRDSNIWFFTFGSGLFKYGGKFLTSFILQDYVRSVAEDKKGNLWFSTEGSGIYKYDGKSFINYSIHQGLPNSSFESSLLDKDGNLWFGTQKHGVTKYDGKSFTTYTTEQGLADNGIWSIREDQLGNLWFGTDRNGVSKFDGKMFTTYTTKQGLSSDAIRTTLLDKKGNLWFGTDGGGISKFDGKAFTNYTTADGLINNHNWALLEDDSGNIWVGSLDGASRFDGSTFINYNLEDGLPDLVIANFGVTQEGEIIIGSQNGIAILTGYIKEGKTLPAQNSLKNEELKTYKPIFEIYNSKRGYPIKDINLGQNAIYLDKEGIVWMGTGSSKTSLMRMDYSALNKNKNPLHMEIQKLKINNEIVIWSDLHNGIPKIPSQSESPGDIFPPGRTEEAINLKIPLNPKQKEEMRRKFGAIGFDSLQKLSYVPTMIELPYSLNTMTIDFGAIEPALPNDLMYQYKLAGYSDQWSAPSNHTQVTFGNIFEGNYQFLLKAQSPFGVWSEKLLILPVRILPPWYRTWWAYGIYLLSLLAAFLGLLRWRTAALLKREKALKDIVNERTTEVVTEKRKSDELLLNIFPVEISEELKNTGKAKTQSYESATILFTDFTNFTKISEGLPASELVELIDYCYKNFEQIIAKYNIEKIKTIGDSFMAAGGLPVSNKTHAQDAVHAALEIIEFMKKTKEKRQEEGKDFFGIRIGINTGPVIAGIVGSKKFAYDIWGDTVNMASHLEHSGEDGKINISAATYQLIRDEFICVYRGKIYAKSKGKIDMYFVVGKAPNLLRTSFPSS